MFKVLPEAKSRSAPIPGLENGPKTQNHLYMYGLTVNSDNPVRQYDVPSITKKTPVSQDDTSKGHWPKLTGQYMRIILFTWKLYASIR